MLRRIDRLVLKEFSTPLLFGVGMFSLLTVSTVVLSEALKFVTRWNLPPLLVAKLVGLAAPEFVVLSIPMGVLLATLLSIGRLNNDHEITALRAAGLSLYRIVAPLLLAGCILAAVTYIGTERVVPYCRQELKTLKNNILLNKTGKVQQERVVLPLGPASNFHWVLVADEIDGDRLRGVNIFYFDPLDKDRDLSIRADHAVWQGNDWKFFKMRTIAVQPSKEGGDRVILEAEEGNVNGFNFNPRSLSLRAIAPEDMSAQQLNQVIGEMQSGPGSEKARQVLDFKSRLQLKYAIPMTPLFFIFIAFPLAILPQRSSNAMGMGLALLIVLSYYTLSTIFQKFGATGALPPEVAAWIPNTALLIAGMTLMERRQRN